MATESRMCSREEYDRMIRAAFEGQPWPHPAEAANCCTNKQTPENIEKLQQAKPEPKPATEEKISEP